LHDDWLGTETEALLECCEEVAHGVGVTGKLDSCGLAGLGVDYRIVLAVSAVDILGQSAGASVALVAEGTAVFEGLNCVGAVAAAVGVFLELGHD
jgi:hypothetical protein